MARGLTAPRVGFATEVQSIRQPRDDENSVMTHFAKHAAKCPQCNDPYDAYRQDRPLCRQGNALAKDVANYIYAKGGKPFSVVDRKRGERIQIEIPNGMEVISLLVKAFDRGFVLTKKPLILTPIENIQVENPPRPSRHQPRKEHTSSRKEYPEERRYRQGDVEIVEIIPAQHKSRKETVYYADKSDRKERPKSAVYHERRGSLYHEDEEKRKRRQYGQEPIVIVAEPQRQRYIYQR